MHAPFHFQKSPLDFLRNFCSLLRAYFVPRGDKIHTCSLRGIFRQVHAPAKNDFNFICR